MPAASVCDPIAAALRHSLEAGQSKSLDDLSTTLAGSASRILQTEIEYEETENYQSTVLEHLKSKYIVLNLPHVNHSGSEKNKGGYSSAKKSESEKMIPSLPEPAVTLYSTQKISLGWKGTLPVGSGMYNVGNTCYLNSTLQALFHVPALVNWLLNDSHHTAKCEQNDGGGECLTCAMAKTLQFSLQKSGGAIKPFYIYNKLKLICRTMVPGQQEDAHEFLRYLLEGMERAYLARHNASKLDSYSKETTPVNQIFGGYIRTEVKCLQCKHVSTTFQHFQDLLVDIRKASTLDEALTSYFSREQLDNNDYKCESCKRRVPATKQFALERPPKVLCVQLKRFSVLGGKISRHIGFKQTVDMGPYLWREPGESPRTLNYKLMSMVTHMGPSVNCGHYTAIAQVSTGNYYSFDDPCVRPISLSNVLSTNAYIMIFEMEPQSQNLLQTQQSIKLNGLVSVKNLSHLTNGCTTKPVTLKPSTSEIASVNGSSNSASKVKDIEENQFQASQLARQKTAGPQKATTFIGPQLPQKLQEKSQPRLVMHIKNGKVLNGNSLVPYDGSSEEEENGSATNSKSLVASSSSLKIAAATSNDAQNNSSVTKDTASKLLSNLKDTQKAAKSNGNGNFASTLTLGNQNGLSQSTKNQNGLNTNGISNSAKHQNGKSEVNNKIETNGKEKWHHPIRVKTGQEERVMTKAAAASSIKGWHVSKDTPSPTSIATPNGWSVTDNNKEDATKTTNYNNTTPSAAAVRNFSGTNRSDAVSHLLKLSNRGYGSSSVPNWNGTRANMEREVNNERREERKRHIDIEEEELDRGRQKKIKMHRGYNKDRANPGYNPFQEHQSGKNYGRQFGNYYNRRNYYYNTSYNNGRPRFGGNNYRPPHQRYHNHSHNYWQHR